MHYLLFALFFIMFASRTLGFDLSLAPGLSVKNAFLYMIFMLLVIQAAVMRRLKLELLSVFVPFGLFVAYAISTWIIALTIIDYPGYPLMKTLMSLKAGPVEHLLVLLIFFSGIDTARRAEWLIRAMVWLVIAGNVVTVMDTLNVPNLGLIEERVDGRVGGPIGSSNEFGAFLALFLPAIIALYWTSRGKIKALAAVGAALSGLAFLMALSRGAIVGLAAGSITGAFYLRKYIPAQTLARSAVGAIVLCVVVVIGGFLAGYGDLLLERFGLLGGSSYDASSGRTVIWRKALDLMFANPVTFITGFGWYAYQTISQLHFATHNTYLNTLYNLGMIGVSLFLVIAFNIVRIARTGLQNASQETAPLLFGFIFGFLSLLFALLFGELHTSWLYVWAFAGVSLRLAVIQSAPQAADLPNRDSAKSTIRPISATPNR